MTNGMRAATIMIAGLWLSTSAGWPVQALARLPVQGFAERTAPAQRQLLAREHAGGGRDLARAERVAGDDDGREHRPAGRRCARGEG